jgi:hypothetical protein
MSLKYREPELQKDSGVVTVVDQRFLVAVPFFWYYLSPHQIPVDISTMTGDQVSLAIPVCSVLVLF